MGLFGKSSPFDDAVASATDGEKEDWSKILAVCDDAKKSSQDAKDCLSSILARLQHTDPHVALQAITLLGSCVSNCGKPFHLHVASREFEIEIRKFLTKNREAEVREKLLAMMRNWAENEFSNDSQLSYIPSLCTKLRQEGYSFPGETQKKVEKPSSVSRENTEDAELAKAIELSLREANGSSPKNKSSSASGGSLYPSTSSFTSSLYPTTTEGRRVRALYDFEAAEDGELTFKAGEIITIIDEADQNWWKGSNQRGEGLFPSNFVTTDLSVEPEQTKVETKRSVQFNEEVRVKKIVKEEVEIDELKMDKLLHELHEADPTDPSRDPPEMRDLIDEVNAMGPLIDTELEQVDRKAAQLNQLCLDLQGSLNLYHSLMRDTSQGMPTQPPGFMAKAPGYPYPPQTQPLNGGGGAMIGGAPMYHMNPSTSLPHPSQAHPNHFLPDVRPANGMPQYVQQQLGAPQPGVSMYAPPMNPQPNHPPNYQDKPPLL